MTESYAQFCTVARGAEALCERWTPLVVRELLCGSKRFNDLHRFARMEEFPPQPVIIQFAFRDARPGEANWWLVVEHGLADLCRDDPGRELTLVVDSTVRALTEVWSGDRTPREVIASRDLRVTGPAQYGKDLWRWLGTSAFAATRRAALERQ